MDKKKVLVTGAGRGIGRAIALAAAKAGYEVIAHYNRSSKPAAELKAQIEAGGGTCHLIQFDVSDRADCRKKLEALWEEQGPLWGIVCNAGICSDNTFVALSDEQWDSVINTNLNGFYNVLSPLVMPMCRKKKGGRAMPVPAGDDINTLCVQQRYSVTALQRYMYCIFILLLYVYDPASDSLPVTM